MGGYGSGPQPGRSTVGSFWALNVNILHRQGGLKPRNRYRWRWSGTGQEVPAIMVTVDDDALELNYTPAGKSRAVCESVYVDYTACNYGGYRPWFLCPGCNRRVGKLYLRAGYFRCRTCHSLTYASCQESGDIVGQAIARMARIQRKMGVSDSVFDYVPPRPKGMHRKKYHRLRKELSAAQQAYHEAFTKGITRIMSRSGGV